MRLINVRTRVVVAAADAYSVTVDAAHEQAFFAMVAGRLRQEFPVLRATLAGTRSGAPIIDQGRAHGVVGFMQFYLVKQEADLIDPATRRVLLPGERSIAGTLEVDDVGAEQARLRSVDGAVPQAGGELISE